VAGSFFPIRVLCQLLGVPCSLTNAFSKKWENHEAALGLLFAYYNFCRVHITLGQAQAMQAGLAQHIWTLAELLK
jgi:hypothetical protein